MARPTQVPGLEANTPAEDAAKLYLAARLADVNRLAEKVKKKHEADAIHDLRVATRRLRAGLRLFDAPRELRADEKNVKRLQDALGALRDAQVQLDRVDALEATPGEAALVERMRVELNAEVARRGAELIPALDRFVSQDAERLARHVQTLAPKGKLGGHRLRDTLRERVRHAEKALEDAMPRLGIAEAHGLRIALKKLRYDAELLAPAVSSVSDALLDRLSSLQDGLGELHDLDVQVDALLLLSAMEAHGQGDNALAKAIFQKRVGKAHEVRAALERFASDGVLKALRSSLKTSPAAKEAAPRIASPQ